MAAAPMRVAAITIEKPVTIIATGPQNQALQLIAYLPPIPANHRVDHSKIVPKPEPPTLHRFAEDKRVTQSTWIAMVTGLGVKSSEDTGNLLSDEYRCSPVESGLYF